MRYDRKKFIAGLGTFVIGSFLLTVFWLPQNRYIVYRNELERFFNARTNWGFAWTVLFGGVIVSAAIVLIVEAFITKR